MPLLTPPLSITLPVCLTAISHLPPLYLEKSSWALSSHLRNVWSWRGVIRTHGGTSITSTPEPHFSSGLSSMHAEKGKEQTRLYFSIKSSPSFCSLLSAMCVKASQTKHGHQASTLLSSSPTEQHQWDSGHAIQAPGHGPNNTLWPLSAVETISYSH